MLNNKQLLLYQASLFTIGLIASLTINEYVKDFDKYHWLLLAPIIFPLVGAYFSIIGIIKTSKYWRLGSILLLLINIGFAGVIFLTYAFSYWQF